jgi:hypothetical protein
VAAADTATGRSSYIDARDARMLRGNTEHVEESKEASIGVRIPLLK